MAKSSLTSKHKREWAQELYLTGKYSQKAIAAKVDVTEKTVGKWKEKYHWDQLRRSLLSSKKEEIAFLYRQLSSLRELFDENGELMNSKEADAVLKLTAAIRNLEQEAGLGEIIEVFTKFTKWLSREDLQRAQALAPLFDEFIQEQIS